MSTSQIPRWAWVGLAFVLLFGLGAAAHSAGWSQGYTMGLLTGSVSGGDSLTPYLVYRGGHGFHPFGFVGGIFRFFAFFLLIGLFFKLLGFACWRRHGEGRGPWHHHYHNRGPHGEGPQQGDTPQPPTPPAEETPGGSQPTVWTHV